MWQDLPINEDGNGQEYFYSLHVPPSKNNEGQKKFSQSARSRCVGPSFPRPTGDRHGATALWNEVFIFDLPPEVLLLSSFYHGVHLFDTMLYTVSICRVMPEWTYECIIWQLILEEVIFTHVSGSVGSVFYLIPFIACYMQER